MHTASPVNFTSVEPDEMIRPALKGTTTLLNGVLAHGSSVKRIIITGTVGTMMTLSETPAVYDETDWNEDAVRECIEQGREASAGAKYCAGKVLAEKAAWEVYEKHKTLGTWDLVVLAPPYVFGPVLHEVSTPETLNESMKDWYEAVFHGNQEPMSEGCGLLWLNVCIIFLFAHSPRIGSPGSMCAIWRMLI